MLSSMKVKLTTAAVLASILMFWAPQQVRADLVLYLQEDGGVITEEGRAVGAPNQSLNISLSFGDFSVTFLGGASVNAATMSELLSSTTMVVNNDASNQHTLNLWVTQTDYSLPSGTLLNVESGLGGKHVTGTTVGFTGIFQAWADKNNNERGTGDFTNGPQTASPSGNSFDTGSAFGVFTRLGTNYSLTSVANLTLSAGGTVNYSDTVDVRAVPEPVSMILVGTGLLGLVVSSRLRRGK